MQDEPFEIHGTSYEVDVAPKRHLLVGIVTANTFTYMEVYPLGLETSNRHPVNSVDKSLVFANDGLCLVS